MFVVVAVVACGLCTLHRHSQHLHLDRHCCMLRDGARVRGCCHCMWRDKVGEGMRRRHCCWVWDRGGEMVRVGVIQRLGFSKSSHSSPLVCDLDAYCTHPPFIHHDTPPISLMGVTPTTPPSDGPMLPMSHWSPVGTMPRPTTHL